MLEELGIETWVVDAYLVIASHGPPLAKKCALGGFCSQVLFREWMNSSRDFSYFRIAESVWV